MAYDYNLAMTINPTIYRALLLNGRDDLILSKEDALCFRAYGAWNATYPRIRVYALHEMGEPFIADVVDNFDNIEYEKINNINVCTLKQAFTDALRDERTQWQVLTEALGDYYYKHNESFDSLFAMLPKDCVEKIKSEYMEDAINYWNED